MPRVLVVEPDVSVRDRVLFWLQEDGLDGTGCGGPRAPEYTCPAGLLAHCPLAEDADVIVLNLWLESDTVLAGTPASQVLLYYLSLGKPVVVLTDGSDALVPAPQEGVAVLRRPPGRAELLKAVRSFLDEGRWGRAPPTSERRAVRPPWRGRVQPCWR